jgi:hypothetical protein
MQPDILPSRHSIRPWRARLCEAGLRPPIHQGLYFCCAQYAVVRRVPCGRRLRGQLGKLLSAGSWHDKSRTAVAAVDPEASFVIGLQRLGHNLRDSCQLVHSGPCRPTRLGSDAILLPLGDAATVARLVWPLSIVFLAAAPIQWMSTLATPLACRAIYQQQYQMGVIVRDFLKAPVAVNDLGLVSRLGNQPVLDMWGLHSKEILDLRRHDPADGWMDSAVTSHDTKFVFIYSSWFKRIPPTWINVGQLRLSTVRMAAAESAVDLYATDPQSARRLSAALARATLVALVGSPGNVGPRRSHERGASVEGQHDITSTASRQAGLHDRRPSRNCHNLSCPTAIGSPRSVRHKEL